MTSETTPHDCSKIVDLLVDYLEGRLSLDTRDELDRHLSGCPNCVSQLRTYRTTVSLLRKLRDRPVAGTAKLRRNLPRRPHDTLMIGR